MSRQKIRKVVGTLKRYDVEYQCTLPHFLELIENIVSGIPTELRDHVNVDWTDGDDCDSGYIEFEVWREETDEEMTARKAQEKAAHAAHRLHQEQQERQILAALKAKYETEPQK